MSVIAKFAVRAVENFGTGNLAHLTCWCDNDMMAAYAESDTDKLFTKYSPTGDMKLHQPQYVTLGTPGDCFGKQDDAFYVMLLAKDEVPEGIDDPAAKPFPGASLAFQANCFSLTDYGHGKQVEFHGLGKQSHRGMDRFRWTMMVDNPPASDQFKPGQDYWVVFYPVARFDRNAAIRAAHSHD